jgi:hypothetical protein
VGSVKPIPPDELASVRVAGQQVELAAGAGARRADQQIVPAVACEVQSAGHRAASGRAAPVAGPPVRGGGEVDLTVADGISAPGSRAGAAVVALVHAAVAVVVDPVVALAGLGMDAGVVVVTVPGVGDPATGLAAGQLVIQGVAVAVAVVVGVPGHGVHGVVIRHAVAVVVRAVAVFGPTGVAGGVLVVAVLIRDEAVPVSVHPASIELARVGRVGGSAAAGCQQEQGEERWRAVLEHGLDHDGLPD